MLFFFSIKYLLLRKKCLIRLATLSRVLANRGGSAETTQRLAYQLKLRLRNNPPARIYDLKAPKNKPRYISIGQGTFEYYPELLDMKVVGETLYTLSRDGIIYVHDLKNGKEMRRHQIPPSAEGPFKGIVIIRHILFVYCESKKSDKRGPVYAIDLEKESIVPYKKASKA